MKLKNRQKEVTGLLVNEEVVLTGHGRKAAFWVLESPFLVLWVLTPPIH